MFKIEQLFDYGWDAFGSEAGETFETVALAQAEIDDHIETCEDAVKCGFLTDAPGREDFRVVPVEVET